MRVAAKVATGIVCRFFKRKIYINIKANVVTMSNCCRRTILRRPLIAAHLGLQHAKAHAKMKALRQRFLDMRIACQCVKGPIFRYLFKRYSDAAKGVSAIIQRSGPRHALCARRSLILSLQAYSRMHEAFVKFYVPLTMAKKLQRAVRCRRVREDYRILISAGLRLRPVFMSLCNRISYADTKRAVGVIQAVRHFQKHRLAYVKCRQVAIHVPFSAESGHSSWRKLSLTEFLRSKFVAYAFVQGLDPKQPKNWTKVRLFLLHYAMIPSLFPAIVLHFATADSQP